MSDPSITEAIAAMKSRYFELLAQEKIGSTPELTARIDKLEKAIKEMTQP